MKCSVSMPLIPWIHSRGSKTVLPQTNKNNIQDFQNQRYIGIFMSQREREREIASERDRESESKKEKKKEKGKRKWKGKEKGKERERERTKAQAILFLNRPGQREKSVNCMYCTLQERAV
jgi:hypothetical protein